MSRDPSPTWCFSLVVVRRGHRFLVVKERKHGQRWYLPAGRVEPGETFAQAAVRETLEESGVPIALEGILRIEHSPRLDGSRMRVVFVARPVDDTQPLSEPNEHSLEARYVTLEELVALDLRGREVAFWFNRAQAGPVFPLDVMQPEGEPQ